MTAALVNNLARMQRAAAGASVSAIDRLEAENRRLRDVIDEQAEMIRQLDDMLCPAKLCPPEWGLSFQQERFVIALSQREWLSNEALFRVIRRDEDSDMHGVVKAAAHHVRRKLRPLGFTIKNLYGRGYAFADRHRVAELLR